MASISERIVFAVGVGVDPNDHLSRHAARTIAGASCVAYFRSDCLDPVLRDAKQESVLVELDSLYLGDGTDDECRAAVCDFVVDLSKKYERVAILFPGNPMLGVSLTQMLSSLSDRGLFRFEVIPAVSSHSTCAIEMKGKCGVDSAVIDVARWLLFDHRPNLAIAYYVYFLHHATHAIKNWDMLERFQSSLLKVYPSGHICYLVRSCRPASLGGGVVKLGIADLVKERGRIEFDTTLIVPPAASKYCYPNQPP